LFHVARGEEGEHGRRLHSRRSEAWQGCRTGCPAAFTTENTEGHGGRNMCRSGAPPGSHSRCERNT
jgi:hypothetical protein